MPATFFTVLATEDTTLLVADFTYSGVNAATLAAAFLTVSVVFEATWDAADLTDWAAVEPALLTTLPDTTSLNDHKSPTL